MAQYNIGDRVECLANCNKGKKGTIVKICADRVYVKYDDCSEGNSVKPSKYYKLISCDKTNNVVGKTMSSLKEAFVMAFLGEPEKSFRKAGITNGDGLLNCEGRELFENWLFQQNKDKFNSDVVQPILADMDKECKK